MSSGQKPRWPAFYPRMKQRGGRRPRPPRIVLYGANWEPLWPPIIAGADLRRPITVTFSTGGTTRQLSGHAWIETSEAK